MPFIDLFVLFHHCFFLFFVLSGLGEDCDFITLGRYKTMDNYAMDGGHNVVSYSQKSTTKIVIFRRKMLKFSILSVFFHSEGLNKELF